MKEKLLTTIFGKTENGERYTFRQWLICVWFSLSLAMLCMVEDAPMWFLVLLAANFAASVHYLKKLPLPTDPEEELDDDEEE